MSSRARYVLDTNILVSAVLFEHSPSGQALRRALKQGEVLVSHSTLEELAEVTPTGEVRPVRDRC